MIRALGQVIEWRGPPQAIRCDNGPEYVSEALKDWADKRGIRLQFVQPGKPQQNAYIERYNRTVRYDWLAHFLFETVAEVREYATNGYGPTITNARIWRLVASHRNNDRPTWPSLYFQRPLEMGEYPTGSNARSSRAARSDSHWTTCTP